MTAVEARVKDIYDEYKGINCTIKEEIDKDEVLNIYVHNKEKDYYVWYRIYGDGHMDIY